MIKCNTVFTTRGHPCKSHRPSFRFKRMFFPPIMATSYMQKTNLTSLCFDFAHKHSLPDTTPHHKSPLDETNEIRRNAADSLWVLKVTR